MEIKHPGQDDSNIWYHGTTSVAASNIARRIDLTVCSHFNHAFGFHRSFYIGDNLKFCLIWALKKAMTLRTVNCALVVFCINEGELHLIQDYLKLISNEDSQILVIFGKKLSQLPKIQTRIATWMTIQYDQMCNGLKGQV
ncbi:hypothetical protein RhiirA1_407904 [Rhizophagus irregularis]|uniref:Uncharacterized protein n=1 Tax=Rhizophagus irregularis TaxID=588596 RepID=A0A2N0SIE8_9GLOM|nr:hypothetical protein RhiirA1_407904 [Rhizophagus irregularis]